MPETIQQAWESFIELRSQGATFGAARELAKVQLWAETVTSRKDPRWGALVAATRLSGAEISTCKAEVADRMARARRLAEDAPALDVDELLLLVTIVLEVALVRRLLASHDELKGMPDFRAFLADFRLAFSAPSLQQQLSTLTKRILRNSGLDVSQILDEVEAFE